MCVRSYVSLPERDELKHRTEELGAQIQELFQKVCVVCLLMKVGTLSLPLLFG